MASLIFTTLFAFISLAYLITYCFGFDENTIEHGKQLHDVINAILERLDEKDEQIQKLEATIQALRTQNELLFGELLTLKDRRDNVEHGVYGDWVENVTSENEVTQRKTRTQQNARLQTSTRRQTKNRRQGNHGGAPVAFFATLINNMQHEAEGDAVPFDNLITNEGSAYRPYPGQFVAPVPGVYVFSVTLQSFPAIGQPPSGYAISKNGVEVSKLYIDGSTSIDNINYETTSQTAVLRLDKGDVVAVKNRVGNGGVHGDHYSSFCGFLLPNFDNAIQVIG